ncbi:L,D-transpeptidase, partial [Priestia megaterium]
SIGKAVSKGCIRMYNAQVNELAQIVPNGTGVYIRPSRRMAQ